MVECVTNIELLKPADTARRNRILFFEVNNRGNKLASVSFNAGVGGVVADRNALSSSGDGWLATRDQRLSIEERYPTKDVYLAAFKKAADDLVAKRFLLPDDADSLVKSA